MLVGRIATTGWLILRCAPSKTLLLELELTGKGLNPWCPKTFAKKRLGNRRKPEIIDHPLMPGFLFLPWHQIASIEAFAKRGMIKNAFSWFRYLGEIVVIKPAELEPLRDMEEMLAEEFRTIKRPKRMPKGTFVKIKNGPFGGLDGMVVQWTGSHYIVDVDGFPGSFTISPFLLEANRI